MMQLEIKFNHSGKCKIWIQNPGGRGDCPSGMRESVYLSPMNSIDEVIEWYIAKRIL